MKSMIFYDVLLFYRLQVLPLSAFKANKLFVISLLFICLAMVIS